MCHVSPSQSDLRLLVPGILPNMAYRRVLFHMTVHEADQCEPDRCSPEHSRGWSIVLINTRSVKLCSVVRSCRQARTLSSCRTLLPLDIHLDKRSEWAEGDNPWPAAQGSATHPHEYRGRCGTTATNANHVWWSAEDHCGCVAVYEAAMLGPPDVHIHSILRDEGILKLDDELVPQPFPFSPYELKAPRALTVSFTNSLQAKYDPQGYNSRDVRRRMRLRRMRLWGMQL